MTQPVILNIAEFKPDLPDLADGSSNIRNVYPRTATSYGSIATPTPQYNAINARAQGAFGIYDSAGNVFIFVGDINDLYLLKAGVSGWQNCSQSPGTYNVAPDEQWQFVYFNGDVIANQIGSVPQIFTLASSTTFSDLPGSPPRGRYIAVVKNSFVVLGNTIDNVNGEMAQRIWWSAAGDAKNWPVLGSDAAAQVQSGAFDLLGEGGEVHGFATDLINADAVVFQEFSIRRMTYVGPPSVFSFLPVENARGTPAPASIVVNGGVVYYWGHDGIYAFDGGASKGIGAGKVDKTLFPHSAAPSTADSVDLGNLFRVVGTADPLNYMVWWIYPSRDSVGGTPDRLLGYNWQLDRWCICNITAEWIFRLLSIGYTLDELFTILGYTIDNLPAPLDSRIWTGGALQLGIFDSSHKLNLFTGNPLTATVESSEVQPFQGLRTLITNSRPLVDGAGTLPQVAVGHRERQVDTVVYTSNSAMNSLGTCPVRASGRYIRVKTTIPTGTTRTWTNISGVEIEVSGQGSR
jgi:hypothetical protein